MAQEMTAQEEQYWLHSLSGDPLIGSFLRTQGMFGDPRIRALNQPVCGRCQKLSLWHENGALCPSCGHLTPKNSSYKLKTHLKEGWYK